MKKLSLFYRYSKLSLIIRVVLTLIFALAIGLVAGLRVEISQNAYGWAYLDQTKSEFEVHYIDVGQGDSTLIKFDDGKVMLIDCGPASSGESLVSYLKDEQIAQIDYFLLTHPDEDHIGGGERIFSNFEVKNFYRPMFYSKSESGDDGLPIYDTSIYDKVITSSQGKCQSFYNTDATTIQGGDNYSIKILYPHTIMKQSNESSSIVQITMEGKKFLFMGDAEIPQESKLCDMYGDKLDSDVLKVGHHGAKNATSDKLLTYVSPTYAVISCGKNNQYGHPDSSTTQLLTSRGVQYFRTDQLGSVKIGVADGKILLMQEGKIIVYALIISLLCLAILLIWGFPEPKKKRQIKK